MLADGGRVGGAISDVGEARFAVDEEGAIGCRHTSIWIARRRRWNAPQKAGTLIYPIIISGPACWNGIEGIGGAEECFYDRGPCGGVCGGIPKLGEIDLLVNSILFEVGKQPCMG